MSSGVEEGDGENFFIIVPGKASNNHSEGKNFVWFSTSCFTKEVFLVSLQEGPS